MSATVVEEFLAAKEKVAAMKKEAEGILQAAFKEGARAVFDRHPNLVAFGWNQYTPYFNDGDPCVFRTQATEPAIFFEGELTKADRGYIAHPIPNTESADEEDDGYVGNWNNYSYLEGWYYGDEHEERKKVQADVVAFTKIFDDEDYLAMFGDHAGVLITRYGDAEVEHFSHD